MSLGRCGARAVWNAYLRDYRRRRRERKAGQSTTPDTMAPTFFTDVDNAMMSACNEIFGPVHSGHGS
jgi:acyl-CoA reductase-like NAD-dependent aldehyde dehydrogenase